MKTDQDRTENPTPPPPEAGEDRKRVPETGGPAGPDPVRYRDWERGGRCVDF